MEPTGNRRNHHAAIGSPLPRHDRGREPRVEGPLGVIVSIVGRVKTRVMRADSLQSLWRHLSRHNTLSLNSIAQDQIWETCTFLKPYIETLLVSSITYPRNLNKSETNLTELGVSRHAVDDGGSAAGSDIGPFWLRDAILISHWSVVPILLHQDTSNQLAFLHDASTASILRSRQQYRMYRLLQKKVLKRDVHEG